MARSVRLSAGGCVAGVSPAGPAPQALFWGCQMGWAGVSAGSGMQSRFTHSSVKTVTLLVCWFLFPSPLSLPFPTQLLMRQFAGARQMQTGSAWRLPRGREQASRPMWHFCCKHVARWRAKSLVGGLYLFLKELVRFIYTRHRLHVLEERGKTRSLSARSPASPGPDGRLGLRAGVRPGSPRAPAAKTGTKGLFVA